MELTTSYQMLGQKLLGTDDYGAKLYIRSYAKYSEKDVQNNRTKVQYEARAYFDKSWSIWDRQSNGSVSGTSAATKSFSRSADYGSGETTLGTTEAWVTHNSDGTMSISASAYLNFPNWGWSGTATGTATLPNLHKPPIINAATMVETNSVLTAISVPNTTIVRYLSKKTITLDATAFDGATKTYRLRHLNSDYALPSSSTYQSSNVFNTDYTTHDVTIGDGKANLIQDIKDSLNGTATDWVQVNINGTIQKPNGIAYSKPTIERASTSIKRKSGGGTTLTDNKAVLNFKGTFYKGNDVIGNNNNIQQIGYKIWEKGTTEPSSYTTLTPTISAGNITVSNLVLSNLIYTKTYNYKIILKDRYGYQDLIADGTLPTGQSVWTEYKDRVDFLKITIQGEDILDIIQRMINGG